MTFALTILTAFIVAGFLLERRLMVRDMQRERRDWANERGRLLDRIKPETSQPLLYGPEPETFQPPETDDAYWDAKT